MGQQVLTELLSDSRYATVHVLVRRPLGQTHPKLVEHLVSFERLPALPPIDHAYIALGTTIKQAGSQAAFRKVDYDAVIATAKAAQSAGTRRLGVVSALGANAQSSVFYNRVKGEMEQTLSAMGWSLLVLARPSLLLGNREALGQPARMGERLGAALSQWLNPLIPRRIRPISSAKVARALVGAITSSEEPVARLQIIESQAMQRLPDRA